MSEAALELPRFSKPPVVETVLGVHFRPVENLTSAHQGLLWSKCFRSRFPILDERPSIEEIRERFGQERLESSPVLRWQLQDRPDVPRLWAASEVGDSVVQIQKSAFYANWLKTSEEVEYRPYMERRREFCSQLSEIDQYLRDEGLGRIEPTSCLVRYINQLDYRGFGEIGTATERVLACWTNQTSDGWLPEPDNLVLKMGFPMPEESGRLHIALTPAVRRADKSQILQLDLTARGSPVGQKLTDALNWIDLGHEWVVRGFVSITRRKMHDIWELTR